jgi:Raf kinase inhibitor-like YbhB/YbcL family protein
MIAANASPKRTIMKAAWLGCALLVLIHAAAAAEPFRLASPDVRNGQLAEVNEFDGSGCHGRNQSPALEWSGVPAGTKSLALLVHDPDAPSGGAGWWHWLVIGLPSATRGLEAGAGAQDGKRLPAGATQLPNDFGTPGWGGPCPPAGDRPHRYVFTLYALDVDRPDVSGSESSPSKVQSLVKAHAIGSASFTARFGRSR